MRVWGVVAYCPFVQKAREVQMFSLQVAMKCRREQRSSYMCNK